jgi:hypothetical protein
MKLNICQISTPILLTAIILLGYASTTTQQQSITISDSAAIALIGGLPAVYVVKLASSRTTR